MGDQATAAPSLAALNFQDDFTSALTASDAHRWQFEKRGDLEVWVTMTPASAPTEIYVVRLFWLDYPGDAPPSVKFGDPTTARLDVRTAWPMAKGFRPNELDICANYTAEGFRTHPEWVKTEHRWRSSGNVMLKVTRLLQHELDTTYGGRFHG
jgi:hypothetical protein